VFFLQAALAESSILHTSGMSHLAGSKLYFKVVELGLS